MFWLAAAFVLVLVIVLILNSLIAKRNQVRNAFSSLDAFLKKRHDLIPNLVEATRGYMQYERGVLHDLVTLRSQAQAAGVTGAPAVDVENRITAALGKVFVLAEQYPDLKASEPIAKLQASLNDIEEQIAAARRAYNAAVTDYNNAVEMLPTNIAASLMRYQREPLLAATATEREPVAAEISVAGRR